MPNVTVATYRESIDHLFRTVNTDYNACVGDAELRDWQDRARRALSEIKDLECKRASPDDRNQQQKAIQAAQERLTQSDARLLQEEAKGSRFTHWLRASGRPDLCPPDDRPRPLASRVAELQKRDGTQDQIRELMRLWENWRLS